VNVPCRGGPLHGKTYELKGPEMAAARFMVAIDGKRTEGYYVEYIVERHDDQIVYAQYRRDIF
jgi:hypothetical protein